MGMDDQEKRAAQMAAKTQKARYEFLTAELSACFAGVKAGLSELESGHRDAAEQEAQKAEKGYKTIVGSLAELDDVQQRAEVERNWQNLRVELDGLQTMLKDTAPD
jgi:hypothetical protein